MPEFLQETFGLYYAPLIIPLVRIGGVVLVGIILLKILDSMLRRLRLLIPADRLGSTRAEQRAETLRHLIGSVGKAVILIFLALQVITVLGFDLGPALASVGILGVAIGFGAQSLVKDVIAGFFVLLEDQYGIGDVVRIGGHAGVVEQMTLRTTVLRNLQGQVHVIPNGAIEIVTVLTKDWSRAIVDVSVAYKENLDPVFEALTAISEAFRQDWKDRVLETPVIMGVEELGADGVTIRLAVRTHPGKQWEVTREMRKRIKADFDRRGIEIPFPQRTVWIRNEEKEEK